MTLVLAHGALGYWDEAIGLMLLIVALPTGVMIALLKGSSGRGTAPLHDDPTTTGQALDAETTAGPASRIGESGDGSGDGSDVRPVDGGRQSGPEGNGS